MNRLWPLLLLGCSAPTSAGDPSPLGAPPAATTRPGKTPPAMRAMVDAHNRHRARHCARPLAWSRELARSAQAWADSLAARGCSFGHSGSRFGENLAAGTESALTAVDAVTMWYREVDQYDFGSGGFSMSTGHFTQLVWAETRHLGCGTSACKGLRIFVCQYDPPGNVEGFFRENVSPPKCGRE